MREDEKGLNQAKDTDTTLERHLRSRNMCRLLRLDTHFGDIGVDNPRDALPIHRLRSISGRIGGR